MTSLRDKAARVSLTGLDDAPAPPAIEVPGLPGIAREAPQGDGKARSGVESISRTIGIHHQVQDLTAKVQQYEAGGAVVMLDPKLIRPSRWMNRHPDSFQKREFEALKEEIAAAGKNIQAIKVRRLVDANAGEQFEIVYGHRRHRACLEIGIQVAAIVQTLTDAELFQEMDRENRHRKDLTPWEQGVMYKQALDEGLFASQNRMAAVLGMHQGNLSTAIRLASLPAEIVAAFPSPLDLQYRWAVPLSQAFEKDASAVLTRADQVRKETPRPAARVVFERLIASKASESDAAPTRIKQGGKVVATWSKQPTGGVTLTVKKGALTEAKEKKLLEMVQRLLE